MKSLVTGWQIVRFSYSKWKNLIFCPHQPIKAKPEIPIPVADFFNAIKFEYAHLEFFQSLNCPSLEHCNINLVKYSFDEMIKRYQ